jgi:hypothetical protein
MAELKAKPLPAELNHALGGGITEIPTAIGEPSQREPERRGEGADIKEKQRRAPATVRPLLLHRSACDVGHSIPVHNPANSSSAP